MYTKETLYKSLRELFASSLEEARDRLKDFLDTDDGKVYTPACYFDCPDKRYKGYTYMGSEIGIFVLYIDYEKLDSNEYIDFITKIKDILMSIKYPLEVQVEQAYYAIKTPLELVVKVNDLVNISKPEDGEVIDNENNDVHTIVNRVVTKNNKNIIEAFKTLIKGECAELFLDPKKTFNMEMEYNTNNVDITITTLATDRNKSRRYPNSNYIMKEMLSGVKSIMEKYIPFEFDIYIDGNSIIVSMDSNTPIVYRNTSSYIESYGVFRNIKFL